MIRRRTLPLCTAICLILLISTSAAQQNGAEPFPLTPADLAQVPLGETAAAVREVTIEELEIFTRPAAEAAVLDRLQRGALVPLLSEGGGWATMDLGGGFLGWMRSDGLGSVETPHKPAAHAIAPTPPPRRPVKDATAAATAGGGRRYF